MGRKGFTLVEVLAALLVLGILFAMAFGVLTQSVALRSDLDAMVSTQAKLRRVVEVFTQDLRSAVLGGLAGTPYPTGRESVSFALIAGGAGYPVLPYDAGGNASFPQAAEVKILSAGALDLTRGDHALIVNAAGEGVVFKVTQVNPVGPSEPGRWYVVHTGCGNTIAYTPNTLLFKVEPLGFRYDPPSGELRAQVGGGGEVPLAFDLSGFRLDYVYEAARGDVAVNPEGAYDYANPPLGGAPPLEVSRNGKAYVLRRLGLALSARLPSRGRMVERTYQAQVELGSNTQFRVAQILLCR